ncbi:putative membrane protein [Rhodopirellula maiorica SM1]|uniref:Putative membrane protein n=2 Tax=Novipirellula TaxID=2795426 RepID=M5RLH1_9BACT|nr:putative membrane protein [Rhodopirellula maiorica SM1]
MAKGMLFLALGILASAMLIANTPTMQVVVLLGISIWAFCRFYYFAFYVIEHYVDPEFKFAGLIAFTRYLLRRKRR